MMYLIITEKPSVGKAIADALGATKRHDGYMEGRNGLVSWCFGHLVEFSMPEDYDKRYERWRYSDLPIIPKDWNTVVSAETQKQFNVLKALMHNEQVTEVICATDAGREGELIFRLVYEKAGCKLPVRRLWISSMEESAILEGFRHLSSSENYDHLYDAALCRAKADWLIGMNATRLYSLLYGTTLHIGRVMSPTMAMITQREEKVQSFKPEPFYKVKLMAAGITAESQRFQNRDEAEQLCARCNHDSIARVTKVEQKRRSENPPLLYDLTSLQRDANQYFGYTAQQTLEYAQSLYEKKLLTYPRTDSRYLTHDMENMLPGLGQRLGNSMAFSNGLDLPVHPLAVINDKKVSDHHAIIPTKSMPEQQQLVASLMTGERDLLYLFCTRLLCAVGNPFVYDETVLTIRCGDYDFNVKGKKVVSMGWQAVWHSFRGSLGTRINIEEATDSALSSNFIEGMELSFPRAELGQGMTTPPPRYTEGSILHAMETAGMEDLPDDAERKGIGTPATRAAILEKLVETGLVEREGSRQKKVLIPTAKGKALAAILPEELLSPKLTADWESRLKQIERGEEKPEVFLRDIEQMITNLTKDVHRVENAEQLFPPSRPKVVACPKCGAAITERDKGFMCENRTCGFILWKTHGFLKNSGTQLSAEQVAKLLNGEQIQMTGLKSPKSKTTHNATVALGYDESGKPILRPSFA